MQLRTLFTITWLHVIYIEPWLCNPIPLLFPHSISFSGLHVTAHSNVDLSGNLLWTVLGNHLQGILFIWFVWSDSSLDEFFSGQQAGENSVEPGCKSMLAQAAVPSFREDSSEEWLMPAVTNTDKPTLKWNQDVGAVVLHRIWGSRMSRLWAPAWMEFGFIDQGVPPLFQELSTFLFQEEVIFSKQSVYLSSVLCSSCQMEGKLPHVGVRVLDLCYFGIFAASEPPTYFQKVHRTIRKPS